MPKRKRKQKVYLGEYRGPASVELAPISRLVDEGALIAGAAARISLKNKLILRILRDGKDFDQTWLADSVRKELRSLAKEKAVDAKRVSKITEKARDLPGEAESNADYRAGDVENLDRRHAMLVGLEHFLDEQATNEDYVTQLAKAVQDSAWDDVSGAITARALSLVGPVLDLTEGDRDLRMDQVRADLRKLARSAR